MVRSAFILSILCLILPSTALGQTYDSHEIKAGTYQSVGPLVGAIFSNPAVGDFSGDGIDDIIVVTRHFGEVIRFYPGIGKSDDSKWFGEGVATDLPNALIAGIDWNNDGLTDLLMKRDGLVLYLSKGGNPPKFSPPQTLLKSDELPRFDYMSAYRNEKTIDVFLEDNRTENYWPPADNTPNGPLSLWNGYDASGRWKGGEARSFIRHIRFAESGEAIDPKQGTIVTGKLAPLAGQFSVSPIVIDADNDHDGDLLFADFVGNFFYAENIETDRQPQYRDPITLTTSQGERFRSPQCMVRGQAVDWNHDGYEDIVFGSEDAFLYVSINASNDFRRLVFEPPKRIMQENPPLDCGVAAVPALCDLDADGDSDIVAGNAAGEIMIVWNRGDDDSPSFALPEPIQIDSHPFRLIAGYNGSIQGPNEASWGYVAPSVADADGDKDLDILFSSVNGYHQYILNTGSPQQPTWSAPKPIYADGQPLRTVWRTRPLMVDWNQDGSLDYICLNQQGEVGMYPGQLDTPWYERRQWVSWKLSDGTTIDCDGANGMEGRSKIHIVDWDFDGRLDLLIGIKGGVPFSKQFHKEKTSYVVFLKCINKNTFDMPRPIYYQDGSPIQLGDHNLTPEAISLFGDSSPGLFLGCENGRFYYYRQSELRW